jgi:hypothetical protein
MDAGSKRGRNDAGFAVTRDYQPARIERELLSQVFEIVGRGTGDRFEPSANCPKPAVMSTDGLPKIDRETAASGVEAGLQPNALEAVA